MKHFLDTFFGLQQRGTSVRTELVGGATTFAAMAYIIVVNPAILQEAGFEVGPSTVATILAAVFGCLLMGLYANRPIAVAPYMGENAFIAYTLSHMIIDGERIGWQTLLGAVFVSGAAFLLLTLLGARTWLANAISSTMKHSFAVGIGLFLLLIGMKESGLVTSGAPLLRIGNLHDAKVLLAIAGFLVMAVLMYWNVRGAMLLGLFAIGTAAFAMGLSEGPKGVVAWPGDYHVEKIAFHLDIVGVLRWSFVPVLLTLFLVSFLDTLGTLVGVGAVGNMLDEQGIFPQIERPMLVDSVSCMFSALAGTSTSGAFIESATGIREGARTGLAAVTTAALFAIALFFIPLMEPLQKLGYVYGPVLMVVGIMMVASVKKMNVEDLTELVPALVTIAMMVFTYNIANGLTAGLLIYPVFKLAAGRWREVHPAAAVLALLCLSYFLFGKVH